jgi:hypothetical protein
MSLADLLDKEIDDLAELPAFEVPPVGNYKLAVCFSEKNVNDKECLEASFKVLETL